MTDAQSISIHALLAESDVWADAKYNLSDIISIHALLAESDYDTSSLMQCQVKFLSTLSLRRATDGLIASANFCKFLSTLSLRRATAPPYKLIIHQNISIHALLAESDSRTETILTKIGNFYPRSPCGERQQLRCDPGLHGDISIHALLAESDVGSTQQ